MDSLDFFLSLLRAYGWLAGGMTLGGIVGVQIAKWMDSPGRCAECHKRIPSEPKDWMCSFQGPSSETAAVLYYHPTCYSNLSRGQRDAQMNAESEKVSGFLTSSHAERRL